MPAFDDDFKVRWLTPRDLGNVVGLLVRQNLHDKRRLRLKRCIDLVLCALAATILLPVGLILALGIRLDSPGSILYRQKRIGQGGSPLHIYKFRTMVADADAALQTCLAANPTLREEWERDHKLRNDRGSPDGSLFAQDQSG